MDQGNTNPNSIGSRIRSNYQQPINNVVDNLLSESSNLNSIGHRIRNSYQQPINNVVDNILSESYNVLHNTCPESTTNFGFSPNIYDSWESQTQLDTSVLSDSSHATNQPSSFSEREGRISALESQTDEMMNAMPDIMNSLSLILQLLERDSFSCKTSIPQHCEHSPPMLESDIESEYDESITLEKALVHESLITESIEFDLSIHFPPNQNSCCDHVVSTIEPKESLLFSLGPPLELSTSHETLIHALPNQNSCYVEQIIEPKEPTIPSLRPPLELHTFHDTSIASLPNHIVCRDVFILHIEPKESPLLGPSLRLNTLHDPSFERGSFFFFPTPPLMSFDEFLKTNLECVEWDHFGLKCATPLLISFRVREREPTPRVKIRGSLLFLSPP